jgi:hypothetical protein
MQETVMISMTALWLPILVSSVIVFIVSSLIHMVLPWHKGDYPKLSNEDQVRYALRPLAIPPGDYGIPRPSGMAEMKSPAFAEKMRQGPVMFMSVGPNGDMNMTWNMVNWFLYTLVVGALVAYVAGLTLPEGSGYRGVFRVVGVVAFGCYALALPQMSIWYYRGWRLTLVSMFDGLIFAMMTAGTFGWLWPR